MGGGGGGGGPLPCHLHENPDCLWAQQQRQKHSEPSSPAALHRAPPRVQLQSQVGLEPGHAAAVAFEAVRGVALHAATRVASIAARIATIDRLGNWQLSTSSRSECAGAPPVISLVSERLEDDHVGRPTALRTKDIAPSSAFV